MRILWIEDNSRFVEVVRQTFLRQLEPVVVRSLAEAKQRLASENFDVVLLDFDLPDGKGTELLETLHALANPRVVIAVSSHAMGNDALLDGGANFVCAKKDFGQIEAVLERAAKLV